MPSFKPLLPPKKLYQPHLRCGASVKKSRLSVFRGDPLDKVLTRTLSWAPFTVHFLLKEVAA